jgi:hypothetical protein
VKLIVRAGKGRVELNYMWLPTFIGMNGVLIKEIEEKFSSQLVGKVLTSELLDGVSEQVKEYLAEKFPIIGLWDYLDGLKFVDEEGRTNQPQS